MNKVDLVSEGELRQIEGEVRKLNATAPILRSSHARVDLENILGIGAFAAQRGELALDVHDAATIRRSNPNRLFCRRWSASGSRGGCDSCWTREATTSIA